VEKKKKGKKTTFATCSRGSAVASSAVPGRLLTSMLRDFLLTVTRSLHSRAGKKEYNLLRGSLQALRAGEEGKGFSHVRGKLNPSSPWGGGGCG